MQNNIINSFLEYNKEQSEKGIHPEASVQIAATQCMDGRVNVGLMTDMPVYPFRNLGGKFDIGGYFGEELLWWVKKGRASLILVTYHYAKGLTERGCKGFHYEADTARAYTKGAVEELTKLFAGSNAYFIQVGVETDEDALVLHGENDTILDLSELSTETEATLRGSLTKLYPSMTEETINALLALCLGNIKHIAETKATKRPLEALDHQENILAIGRGFEWFLLPNKMLTVGPYSRNLSEPIAIAGKILLENITVGRITLAGKAALITSAVYEGEGVEKEYARTEALSLAQFSLETLKREVPELVSQIDVLSGIVDAKTRVFTPVSSI